MFALLLALVGASSPSPVVVTFSGGQQATVQSPVSDDYRWEHVETQYSPDRKAAAVRFCWELLRFEGCEVRLAQIGRPVLILERSFVRQLLWTSDSQYLIGAGYNTVHLWNRQGQRQGVVIPSSTRHGDPPLALALKSSGLCVKYTSHGQNTTSTWSYVLPSLKPVARNCTVP